jgi:hypothetical protein
MFSEEIIKNEREREEYGKKIKSMPKLLNERIIEKEKRIENKISNEIYSLITGLVNIPNFKLTKEKINNSKQFEKNNFCSMIHEKIAENELVLEEDFLKELDNAINSKEKKLGKKEYYEKGTNINISYRKKSDYDLVIKFKRVFKKFQDFKDKKKYNKLFKFIKFILNLEYKSSKKFYLTFKKFETSYGKEITDIFLRDIYGFQITDFNNERFENRLNSLEHLNSKSFDIVDFENKLERNQGIHINYFTTNNLILTFEIQFFNLKSLIYDRFGPTKHALYVERRGEDL